ncbi:MAG: hypothetical protein ACRYFU_14240 [Janthinobacterium lividum]
MASLPTQVAAHSSRLHLVASPTQKKKPRLSPLALWHLLSLDAPSVAALWVIFAGRSAGIRLPAFDPLAMFIAVWMLYAADRLLDARPLTAGVLSADLEERHRFHHRHRAVFVPCIALAALPLACLLHELATPVLHLYALLASLLAGWLLLVHAQPAPSAGARRLPKEFAVGLFFPAAVFIPTVARAPALRLALLPGAFLFAGVCTLNCLFLYAWEHPRDRSRAHASTGRALQQLVPLATILLIGSTSFCLLAATGRWFRGTGDSSGISRSFIASLPHPAMLPAACALSIALLLALHAMRQRFSPLRLRALADVALLTPLLFLVPMLFQRPR